MRLVALLLVASAAGAQPPPPRHSAVLGTVYDSLSHAPLRAAEVSLDSDAPDAVPRSATTDARGAFRLDSLPAGAYTISFSHPTLDSLGIGIAPARLRVGAGETTVVTLATPSVATIARRACPGLDVDTAGVLVGRVRRGADGTPAAARVSVQWSEWESAGTGLVTELHTVSVVSSDAGAYVACGVPNDVLATVQALAHGMAGRVEEGEVQIDLHQRVVTVQDLAVAPPAATATHASPAAGTAALMLTVRDADGHPVPIAHATVDDIGAVADDSGVVRLADVPAGSRVATVRALGYEPATVSLVLRAGATASERVTLGRSRVTQLGTVRVSARRAAMLDRTGFEVRRLAGFGQFMTADQIARRQVDHLSDVLRTMPGVLLKPLQNGIGYLPMSARNAKGNLCPLTIYVDRMRYDLYDGTAVDDVVNPTSIRGIEVYLGAAEVPSEFHDPRNSCGAILIWTQASRP